MSHRWRHLEGTLYRCRLCGLDRHKWPILGLCRGFIFDGCTGDPG